MPCGGGGGACALPCTYAFELIVGGIAVHNKLVKTLALQVLSVIPGLPYSGWFIGAPPYPPYCCGGGCEVLVFPILAIRFSTIPASNHKDFGVEEVGSHNRLVVVGSRRNFAVV
jgi:hypothetical protein